MPNNTFARHLTTALRPVLCVYLAACSTGGAAPGPAPGGPVVVDTVVVEADPELVGELEQRIAILRFQLFERGAQLEDLQRRLEAARRETVRAMARVQTSASRAEAASVMAETEIALETLAGAEDLVTAAEAAEAKGLLELSAQAFATENYGGALYLAIQARRLAREGELRATLQEQGDLERDEVFFALPLPLETTRDSNVRAGPGIGHRVVFTLAGATPVVGRSYSGQWVHITDDEGRRGWIFHSLVTSPGGEGR